MTYFDSRRGRSSGVRSNLGCLVALLLALLAIFGIGACTYVKYVETGTVTFTINRLDDQAQSKGHKYLIFTSAGVYEDTDNVFHGKFNSSDLFAALQVGRRYRCTYTGYRVPLFSSYRNLIGCRQLR